SRIEIYTWSEAIRQAMPPTDAWFVPIYAVVAIALLVHRRRSIHLERALSEARTERLTLERLARVSLALRDLANTPLQTLTAGMTLLRRDGQNHDQVLASMERALERLDGLRHALLPFEQHVEWRPHDESFDALVRIEQIAGELGGGGER